MSERCLNKSKLIECQTSVNPKRVAFRDLEVLTGQN